MMIDDKVLVLVLVEWWETKYLSKEFKKGLGIKYKIIVLMP